MKKTVSVLVVVLLLAGMLSGCGLTVERPDIKEARFNFSVTYELNGEAITFTGVYVCEYTGVSWSLDGGYSRGWTGYIENNPTTGRPDNGIEICTTEDGGKIILDPGLHPAYFMNDPVYVGVLEAPVPTLILEYATENENEISFSSDEEDLAKHGVKLISYEYDAPVSNTFGSVFS